MPGRLDSQQHGFHTQNGCGMFSYMQSPMTQDVAEKMPTDDEKRILEARLRRRTRLFQLMFALCVVLYALMAVLARFYPYYRWDLAASRAVQSIAFPGAREFMLGLSALGSGWLPVALVGVAGIALFLARYRTESLVLMAGAALSSSANSLLKILSGRPRPGDDLVSVITTVNHASFPSGHTVFFVVFFGFLLYLAYVLRLRPGLRHLLFAVLGAMIALIGISRMYLGAHWLSDVVGGYLIGSIWLVLMTRAYSRLKAGGQESGGRGW